MRESPANAVQLLSDGSTSLRAVGSEATRPAGGPATAGDPATADGRADGAPARTVRDATFDVLRARGLDTIFSNPGSTEVPLLAGLPSDLRFVLALHEGSVVGLATGVAIGSGAAAFVLLHTTAGLGNAVAALATARVNRAPLVVSSVSRTAGTSRSSRSSPGASTASQATTRCRWAGPRAHRTFRARSRAPTTRR